MTAIDDRLAELRAREKDFAAREAREEQFVPQTGWPGQRWGRNRILDAMRRFYEQHGRAPTTTDWKRAGVDNPVSTTVRYHFGSFSYAVELAGLALPEESVELSRVRRLAEEKVVRLEGELRRAREEVDALRAAMEHMADLRSEE